ncbi:hypothetical protein JCM11641_005338 [Rhodosporidiobolus odoratus]
MLNPIGSTRVRHGAEDEEIAYRLQVMGAREGFLKGSLVGGTLMFLANWRFPWVRRQTLAGKVFLASWASIFGMVTHADHYLLEYEKGHRASQERWRTMARNELAAKGVVPSETHMREWKADYDSKLRDTLESKTAASSSAPSAAAAAGAQGEEGRSKVLQEIEVGS